MNQILVVAFEYFDPFFKTNILQKFPNFTNAPSPKFVHYFFPDEMDTNGHIDLQPWDLVIHPAKKMPDQHFMACLKNYKAVYLSVSDQGDKLADKQVKLLKAKLGRKLHHYVPFFPKATNPLRSELLKLADAFKSRNRWYYLESLGKIHNIFNFDLENETRLQLLNQCWKPEHIEEFMKHGWKADYRTKNSMLALLNNQAIMGMIVEIKENKIPERHTAYMKQLNQLLFSGTLSQQNASPLN